MVFRSGLGPFTTVKDEVMVKITLYQCKSSISVYQRLDIGVSGRTTS